MADGAVVTCREKATMEEFDIDVIIITYNSKPFVSACIDSLLSSRNVCSRITVVDNASTDGTVELIEEEYPSVRVLGNTENMGYAQAVNKGVTNVDGDFFIVANADVVFNIDAAREMVEHLAAHHDVGVVGPQQVFPDGRWQRSYGNTLGIWGSIKNVVGITSFHNWTRRLAWPREIDKCPKKVGYIDGAVMAIRRMAFESVGGFDESFFFYGEEADFCLRLSRSGWKVVFLPSARIIHARGGSSTKVDTTADKYLRLQVNSKLHLVRKRYRQWQLYLFIQLERINAKNLALVYRIINWFSPRSKSAYLLNMATRFDLLAEIWREHLVE